MPLFLFSLALCALIFTAPLSTAAEDLDRILEREAITFAMSGQYPPFNFVDERNRLTGFDVEICTEIARRIGVEPRPLTIEWDGIVAGLLAGRYDLICGSMAITEQRLQAIDFSDPYYRSGAQLFTGSGSSLESVDELSGNKIGATLGTTYEEWARTHIPTADVRTYKGVPAMVLEVATGRIDAFISDRIVGAIAIDEKNAPIRTLGPLLYEEQMGIALRQGNPALKDAINKALEGMKEDGTYRDISMKWLKIDAR